MPAAPRSTSPCASRRATKSSGCRRPNRARDRRAVTAVRWWHEPMRDFGCPLRWATDDARRPGLARAAEGRGRRPLDCAAGIGRTGTTAACLAGARGHAGARGPATRRDAGSSRRVRCSSGCSRASSRATPGRPSLQAADRVTRSNTSTSALTPWRSRSIVSSRQRHGVASRRVRPLTSTGATCHVDIGRPP